MIIDIQNKKLSKELSELLANNFPGGTYEELISKLVWESRYVMLPKEYEQIKEELASVRDLRCCGNCACYASDNSQACFMGRRVPAVSDPHIPRLQARITRGNNKCDNWIRRSKNE